MFFIICLLSFSLGRVEAYSINYYTESIITKWDSPELNVFVNPRHQNNFSSDTASLIISQSVNQWNLSSPRVKINMAFSEQYAPQERRNDIYFSTTSSYLGPSVAGVTVTTHDQVTGSLIEADIIINDNLELTSSSSSGNFLGDIISHELGHLLGLGHSAVRGSSMFYRLTKGQSILHEDDKAGIKSLYPYDSTSLGSLRGQIVGGPKKIGIFGAHVSAISLKTGRAVAGTITDATGNFKIEGLPTGDQYFVYVDKLKGVENFSSFYSSVKSDFCNSKFDYRGSFYQTCLTKDEGFPQGVDLTTASRNKHIGVLTIRCGLDVPTEYLVGKSNQEFVIKPSGLAAAPNNLGEAFVGFFTQRDLAELNTDEIHLDFTEVNLLERFGNKNMALRVNLSPQDFYSPVHLSASVLSATGAQWDFPTSQQVNFENVHFDQLGLPTTNLTAYLPLDRNDSENNYFEILITPQDLVTFTSTRSVSLDDYLPAFDLYGDDLSFYLFSVELVEQLGPNQYETLARKIYGPVKDNRACTDANEAYNVNNPEIIQSLEERTSRRSQNKKNELDALGCGMIVLEGSNGPKPPSSSLPIGLTLAFLVSVLGLEFFKSNRLSL